MSWHVPTQHEMKRIRRRKSYKMWSDFHEWLTKKERQPFEVIREVYRIMDYKGAFGSITQSQYAEESLTLLEMDVENEQVTTQVGVVQ